MDQYELIRTAHRVYKKSIRQIARETGHTRRTIRKVLAGQEPRYRREKEPACPVMDGVNGNRTLHAFLTIRSGAEVRVRTTGPRVGTGRRERSDRRRAPTHRSVPMCRSHPATGPADLSAADRSRFWCSRIR